MVRDWEPGGWLQCLVSLLPFFLDGPHCSLGLFYLHSAFCSTAFWFPTYILFKQKKQFFFFSTRNMNFNIFQEKISQIRAPSCDFEAQITILASSLLNVIARTGLLSENFQRLWFSSKTQWFWNLSFDNTELWSPSSGIWTASTSMEYYALRVCTAGGSANCLAPAGTFQPQIITNNRSFTFAWWVSLRNLNLMYFLKHSDPLCGQKLQNPCYISRFEAKLKHCSYLGI